MKYTVEDVSPVEKKVLIEVEPENVNATIMATGELYKDAQVPGYRKGKVPRSVIEQKYKKHIYGEAREDLVNIKLNELLATESFKPIGPLLVVDQSPLERDKPFSFSIQFEVLPQPKDPLPNYEGLSVKIEHAKRNPNYLAQTMEAIRQQHKKVVSVSGKGPAVDGQVVNFDCSFIEDGKELTAYSNKGLELEVSPKAFVPDFYALVTSTKIGEEKTGDVSFPADFLSKEFAGKTLTAKIRVNSIKRIIIPEITDAWCKRNKYKSVEDMKRALLQSEEYNLRLSERRSAEYALAQQLLQMVDIPLSPFYCKRIFDDFMDRAEHRANRMGYRIKNIEELRNDYQKQAEFESRVLVLFLLIAQKENLSVTDREVENDIYQIATNSGIDFLTLRKEYERTGEIFAVRDHLLADKAAELVYSRAKVSFVEKTDKADAQSGEAQQAPAEAAAPAATAAEAPAASETAEHGTEENIEVLQELPQEENTDKNTESQTAEQPEAQTAEQGVAQAEGQAEKA